MRFSAPWLILDRLFGLADQLDALGGDGGDAYEHEAQQKRADASEDSPDERLLHEPGG